MLSTLNPINPQVTSFSSQLSLNFNFLPSNIHYPYKNSIPKCFLSSNYPQFNPICCDTKHNNLKGLIQSSIKFKPLKKWDFVVIGLIKSGIVLSLVLVCSIIRCNNVLAIEKGSFVGGNVGFEHISLLFRNAWPVILKVLGAFKEHGFVLVILLGLSAFFSMAETSITTLWPWKVRELAEKDTENGVFKMLRNDVTRFLTTILIGTTVVNIAATALVTEAATTLFGEAGISAATGVMTVAILLLTEITPKSIAVHHPTEVVRFVVRPVAWLSLILYPVGRVVTYISGRMLKLLGLKAESEPNVTEEELKLMLRVAELSGAIEEEEQDMIENLLEIKDTHIREVMTPLVDVIAIDEKATLMDFHKLWVLQQFSRVPVFEQRIDNIVGIAYAMDLLDILRKQEQLDGSMVKDIVQPAFFVPDSMSVWNLLREFRIRKVHMAVVLNEYGGTIGIVTMEDVVEEIVGEIFDENDSKEEIQKKNGYIIKQGDGVFDVDAGTSIDQLCEDLEITLPERVGVYRSDLNMYANPYKQRDLLGVIKFGNRTRIRGHHYETVSGFVCKTFGCIPRAGESVKVVLERVETEDHTGYKTREPHHTHSEEKHQLYKLEILAATARKVTSVRFKRVKEGDLEAMTPKFTPVVPKIMRTRLRVNEDSPKNNDGKLFHDDTTPEREVDYTNNL